jgi:gentisate 1,2-dioxygenase
MAIMADSLEDLYAWLRPKSLYPGWNKKTPSLYPEPYKTYVPAQWHYRDVRSAMERAGRLVDTKFADRRNLIMANPASDTQYNTTATLISAYQMLQPGEHARSHRHTPNALRLILEGDEGSYSVVNGERFVMLPGDVVLTPGWSWHGHGNDGKIPGFWVDYLDVPLVHALEPMFFEEHPEGFERNAPTAVNSPMRFTWKWTEDQLSRATVDPSGRFGRQIRLEHPVLKTFGLFMHAHAKGATTKPLQTTVSNIYSVVSGTGRTTIDGTTFTWERGDTFVVPPWRSHVHEFETDTVLFRVTDQALMEALGFLREA